MIQEPSRQSFLGPNSDAILACAKLSVIGASGGGSHVIQQAAHVGIRHYVIVDQKRMAPKHLHRIVGATHNDVIRKTPKSDIGKRLIKGIQPKANVRAIIGTWQENQLALRDSTAIIGCVDSYTEREQLERFCRRFLIPYIDIGMDVFPVDDHFHICGQIALSSPGHACLRCMGIITDNKLEIEAAEYGAAGPKAQVIWPNAILASSAIGLFVQLICPWGKLSSGSAYLEYNGNVPSLTPSPRMEFAVTTRCPHYSTRDVGDPLFVLSNVV